MERGNKEIKYRRNNRTAQQESEIMRRERRITGSEKAGTINTQLQKTSARSLCELDKPVISFISDQKKT